MTHLRQQMLDELQRRNYSQSTVTFLHPRGGGLCEVLPPLARRLGPGSYPRSTRRICFASASCRPGPSQAALQLCGFSSSRRCAGRIFPMHIPFPKRPRQLPTVLSPARGGAAD